MSRPRRSNLKLDINAEAYRLLEAHNRTTVDPVASLALEHLLHDKNDSELYFKDAEHVADALVDKEDIASFVSQCFSACMFLPQFADMSKTARSVDLARKALMASVAENIKKEVDDQMVLMLKVIEATKAAEENHEPGVTFLGRYPVASFSKSNASKVVKNKDRLASFKKCKNGAFMQALREVAETGSSDSWDDASDNAVHFAPLAYMEDSDQQGTNRRNAARRRSMQARDRRRRKAARRSLVSQNSENMLDNHSNDLVPPADEATSPPVYRI
jgi:hypothetical protein